MALSSAHLLAARDSSNIGTPVLRRATSRLPVPYSKLSICAGENPRDEHITIKQNRVRINVSGTMFETFEATLARFPETLLGDKSKRLPYFDEQRQCLFFNRCRISFEAILFFFQSHGCLIRPCDKNILDFEQECIFYGLSDDVILNMKEREGYARHDPRKLETTHRTYREKFHDFLEHPNSSFPARCFAVLSLSTVVASVFMACITTIPHIRSEDSSTSLLKNPLSLAEFVMNTFFGLELILRFFSAPNRSSFIKSPMNAVDTFAVFPYFIIFAVDKTQIANLGFIKALRTIRVLRFLRFSRHSDTLRVVLNILSSSVQDLFTVVFCMLLMSIVWGSLAFYIELGTENTQFTSIPEGMWWAIQTVVCLGYGDVVPVTLPGKIAAATVAVVGALTLTVPLLSIGGRYLQMYSRTFAVSNSLDVTDEEAGNVL